MIYDKMFLTKVPKKDYYENMYDIENLTSLNRKKSLDTKDVEEIVDLIRNNKCIQAKDLLKEIVKSKPKNPKFYILLGALEIKDLVLEGEELSPKESSLRELQDYLSMDKKEIEKKMLVEVPVKKEWKRINPDPRSEEEVTNFYISTDAYIYELMAANHLIQTLYSFYVLKEKMKELNIQTILDYGAGAGTLCILFKKLGYNVIYADLPGKLFDFAKYRFKKRNLDIKMINLKEQSIEGLKKDCILSTEVLEHVVYPKKLINLFERNLKTGEILIVSESFKYTEDFSSHLKQNKKYGGPNFFKLMKESNFIQMLEDPFIPQMIFEKK